MKTFRMWILLMLVLGGCVSASMDKYQYVSLDQIQAKRRANNTSQQDMYNYWRYAGSDDKYDYIYEYKPGIFLSPPSNFHYYKLDKGALKLDGRYPFNPDPKGNSEIFSW